jgi:hypothetical protein
MRSLDHWTSKYYEEGGFSRSITPTTIHRPAFGIGANDTLDLIRFKKRELNFYIKDLTAFAGL